MTDKLIQKNVLLSQQDLVTIIEWYAECAKARGHTEHEFTLATRLTLDHNEMVTHRRKDGASQGKPQESKANKPLNLRARRQQIEADRMPTLWTGERSKTR